MTLEEEAARILVVEDSPTQAKQLQLVLEGEGFQVVTAPDAEEGLARVSESDFDLVVSDVVMPGQSGFDLCRKIKSDPQKRQVPVVFLSVLADPKDFLRGLECGADNYLTKPFDPESFVRKIRTILKNRQVRGRQDEEVGLKVEFMGQAFQIGADREHVLRFLISMFEEVAPRASGDREVPAPAPKPKRTGKILIVDDSATQRQELSLILESEGFQIDSMPDAERGFEAFDRGGYDLVISDVVMPGMDGFEFCCRIKAEPRGREFPVILVTTLSDPLSILRGLECGADNFIVRPFEPEALVGRVRNILAGGTRPLSSRREVGIKTHLGGKMLTVTSSRGQILDFLISTFEDVVLARESAQRSRKAAEAAREAKEFLQSTVDALSAHIAIVDAAGKIVAVNARWQEFASGLPALAGEDHLVSVLESGGGELRGIAEGVTDVLEGRRDGLRSKCRINVVGKPRWFLVRVGRFPGRRAVVAFEDISELKEADAALRGMEEQVRQTQKMEAFGRLAAGVAHDFNNLITAITGYSDLALRQLPEDSALRDGIGQIRKAGDRAAALTRQLMAFSRKQKLELKSLNLNDIVLDMKKMLRRLIGEDIDLATDLAKDLGLVRADPGRMEQVLLNLAVNARDAMPKGGKLVIETENATIQTAGEDGLGLIPGKYVRLSVSDNGIGMDEETRQRIFEPFFTTKAEGKGTGLGLSTVFGIIQQSGGDIVVHTEPGVGTRFEIHLPGATGVTDPGEARAPKPRRGSETVLLVEDEEAVRKVSATILRSEGYTVLEACSAEEALKVESEHRGTIDLLISDLVMPGASGSELARDLRASSPGIKTLLMSGYTETTIGRYGSPDEEIGFIHKPFKPDDLLRMVRKVLDAG